MKIALVRYGDHRDITAANAPNPPRVAVNKSPFQILSSTAFSSEKKSANAS
jgi:hypothetical protein